MNLFLVNFRSMGNPAAQDWAETLSQADWRELALYKYLATMGANACKSHGMTLEDRSVADRVGRDWVQDHGGEAEWFDMVHSSPNTGVTVDAIRERIVKVYGK